MSPQPEAVESPPFVPWERFLPRFLQDWGPNDVHQARHVSCVGPTDSGKSTLMLALLQGRAETYDSAELIVATKSRDLTLARMRAEGWVVRRDWPPSYGQDRVIFWPRYGDPQTARARQKKAIRPVLNEVFSTGLRVVYFDEAFTLTEMGFGQTLTEYWAQGRAHQLIVVAATQRPVKVPREMWSEARHLFAFRINDLRDIETLGQIGSMNARTIAAKMDSLADHEALYVNLRTGAMARTRVT